MERTINIIGEINEQLVKSVIEQTTEMRNLINEDNERILAHNEKVTPEFLVAPEPVIVNISSNGGLISYGNAIIDELKSLNAPIITRCLGSAASMGYIIFLNGDYRLMGNSAFLMYHGASNGLAGLLTNIKSELDFDFKLEEIIDNFIVQTTYIKQKNLDYVKDRGKNWYMFKDEALNNNSVTHDLDLEDTIRLCKKEWIHNYKKSLNLYNNN